MPILDAFSFINPINIIVRIGSFMIEPEISNYLAILRLFIGKECNAMLSKNKKESLMIYELENYFGTCAERVDDWLQFCYEIRLQTEIFK